MSKETIIVWFRQDLRLADNPALHAAASKGDVLPVYILDDDNAGERKMGAASRVWLHTSLQKLNESLSGHLILQKGDAAKIIPELVKETGAKGVYWNRCYEPWRIKRDKAIKQQLDDDGLDIKSFNGSLLWEPWDVKKDDGTPYKVFTPYYRKGCLKAPDPRKPLQTPSNLSFASANSLSLSDLELLPPPAEGPWDEDMISYWQAGETGARERLKDFLADGIGDYKEGRNMPAQENVSRLSPHLHWGEISPNQVWYAAMASGDPHERNIDCFLSELGWREFSYSLLYYNPEIHWKNLQEKFDTFPWNETCDTLPAWQTGHTGYPIVDAGMRELWATGYMHNRVRMVVGSFLVKHLLTHWRRGEEWFWDCLVDADAASNTASWQWIAGCGADAAPYFRVFNPITQGEKFDPKGVYIRRWVPELEHVEDKYIHKPWESPNPPADYPAPVVDHKAGRERALQAFKEA